MTKRTAARAAVTGTLAAALLGLAPYAALAAAVPAPPAPPRASLTAAHDAAAAPATLATLARFFAADAARGGARAAAPAAPASAAAAPRIEGAAVPVYELSPDFVRGTAGAPVARLEFMASKAVAADGRTASVWTVHRGGAWKVVNIASGDDETRYPAAAAAHGAGTVFHEPQIDAWYVQRGDRIEPLDADARKAVGAGGTTVTAYRKRVAAAYGDKLPGSAYDRRGEAGGYGPGAAAPAGPAPAPRPLAADAAAGDAFPVTAASAVAAAAAVFALGLSATAAVRRRRTR
ncbi:hypothetical protein MUU72_02435 [Streptomyces sp. RS10V-4]|uniref:hypothetical protein n=1 Tax=Streptomyces rhizoryzae TaxID=2932493 RepID=UPI0020049EFF|nr:hypothetical protein [Streptomyces rhizoryzae]MCK7621993.1 hypothetical protein [Streptomyces rhizoryzae]